MEVFDNRYEEYVLYVDDLSIQYTLAGRKVYALNHVTFGVKDGESLGFVGESGCGKSTLALALTHILPQNSIVTTGRVFFRGKVIVDSEKGATYTIQKSGKERKLEEELKIVRWKGISIIFQGALDSLNPLLKVGNQLSDIFVYREKMDREGALVKSKDLLSSVGLDPWIMDAYPHQLSGGMKQRVVIAMAISLHPSLIIADEPTTSLDVITEYRIIEELRRLRDSFKLSLISISHDISMISNLADRVFVMYAGRIVEKLPLSDFTNVMHPYTFLLKESMPHVWGEIEDLVPIRGAPPGLTSEIKGCPFYDRCDYKTDICLDPGSELLRPVSQTHEVACVVLPIGKIPVTPSFTYNRSKNQLRNSTEVLKAKNITKIFSKRSGLLSGKNDDGVRAVDHVNLQLNQGESLALVGETGSGKTTISRIIGLLETPTSGEVNLNGQAVDFQDEKGLMKFRGTIQTIFQDPFQSLNPRFSIWDIVAEPLRVSKNRVSFSEIDRRVREALELAELTPVDDYINKFPHQLSGGQRQRVSIGRALIRNPKILVADEPISMLDVSLRAGILNLMKKLRVEMDLTLFYITHDIASARYISDRIMVMYRGQIVEYGDTETIIKHPVHPYTISLVLASMGIKGGALNQLGDKIFNYNNPSYDKGCRFSNRCPFATSRCEEEEPGENIVEGGHMVRCHYAADILKFTKNNDIKPGVNMKALKDQMNDTIP